MILFKKGRTAVLVFAYIASVAGAALSAQAGEAGKTVVIESYSFSPGQIKVKKGTTVTFTNKDSAPHTVTPENKNEFVGTGRLLKDETKTVVFDHAGKIKYFCDFHPSMEGVVIVTDN